MNIKKHFIRAFSLIMILAFSASAVPASQAEKSLEQEIINIMHSISSHTLLAYVKGKIVLLEREVPVSPDAYPLLQRRRSANVLSCHQR